MMTSVMEILENIMGKVENAGLPAFSTFPKMFSKAFLPEYPPPRPPPPKKKVIVWQSI